MNIWFTIFYQPLVNLLILFYNLLAHNLGLAIIGLTIAIRAALIPLTNPSMQAAQKIKDLSPDLAKLKDKHKEDKQAFARAQLELYQKHGINPAAGCLPQIVQLVILIALFQAFNQVLKTDGEVINKLNAVLYPALKLADKAVINTKFLYLELTKPDLINLPFKLEFGKFVVNKIPGLFLILAAITQFWSSKLMVPQVKKAEKEAKKTPGQEDDLASAMQMQMLYLMPIMTLVIGFNFASGVVLYWFTFSLFMLVTQLVTKKPK